MKAYVLHGIGDFRMEEVKVPEWGEQEALVEVKAAGICGSDITRIYQMGAYSYPLIPGHEFSGQVVKVGTRAAGDWLGKRVGVFPLIPCKRCRPCQYRQYERCRNYSYLGSRVNGGFGELVRVPLWNLMELPHQVGYDQAAMLEPMAVAVHAMRKAKPAQEDRVIICGLGTIGLLLVMFLLEQGVRNLFLLGNKGIQKQIAMGLGVSESRFCDVRTADVDRWIKQNVGEDGAEIFFECAGKNQVLDRALCYTAPGGTVQLIGNPVSAMNLERDVYWKILRNELTIYGSWNSSFTHSKEDDWHYVSERLRTSRIHPEYLITHPFAFDELGMGFEIMRDKSEEYVKVMGYKKRQ